MSEETLLIVLSHPPEGVSEADFEAFYERHLGDVITVPGFEAARFYRVTGAGGALKDTDHRYLALYRMTGDPGAAHDELVRLSEEPGRIYLSEWFDDVPWASWFASPLAGRSRSAEILAAQLRIALSCDDFDAAGYQLGSTDDPNAGLPAFRWAQVQAAAPHAVATAHPNTDSGLGELTFTAAGPVR